MFARVCLILLTLFSLNSQAQTITIKKGQHFAIIMANEIRRRL